MEYRFIVARLWFAFGAAALLSQPLAAQDTFQTNVRPQDPVAVMEKGGISELALGDELLRLNDRIAALERLIVQMVALGEENARTISQLSNELERFRADAELRLEELTMRSADAFEVSQTIAPSVTTEVVTQFDANLPVDRYEQAMGFVEAQDWISAELALSTFIANNSEDTRVAEARYYLGLSYLGQGQAGQAASIFLELFQSGASGNFGANNLFALARALRALDDVDAEQICSVYSEIEAVYGNTLSPARREELLDLQLNDCVPLK